MRLCNRERERGGREWKVRERGKEREREREVEGETRVLLLLLSSLLFSSLFAFGSLLLVCSCATEPLTVINDRDEQQTEFFYLSFSFALFFTSVKH
jgi:hypothetical protein